MNRRTAERIRWKRWNFAYTRRVIETRNPYGLDLLRCWPMRVIRAFAARYGFEVTGDSPKVCTFKGY